MCIRALGHCQDGTEGQRALGSLPDLWVVQVWARTASRRVVWSVCPQVHRDRISVSHTCRRCSQGQMPPAACLSIPVCLSVSVSVSVCLFVCVRVTVHPCESYIRVRVTSLRELHI